MRLRDCARLALLSLLIAFNGYVLCYASEEKGRPFMVLGERLDCVAPKGWKLAWMEGEPEGGYLAEFIEDGENINTWRGGYLAIERHPYPPAEVLEQISKINARLIDVALFQYVEKAKSNCGGTYQAMNSGVNTLMVLKFPSEAGFASYMARRRHLGKEPWWHLRVASNIYFAYSMDGGLVPRRSATRTCRIDCLRTLPTCIWKG